ncbi:MAG: hypothetical protein JST00_18255 [Deltaproteobacteria bacterium]|nr:hypothetical protein [Deltaproteobacteria bacterium]
MWSGSGASPFPLEGGYEVVGWLRAHARELGPAAVAPLAVVARQGTVPLRAAALLALAELDPRGTELFVLDRARTDPSPEVREAATRALGRSQGDAALAYLVDTDEERAARIALRERYSGAWSDDLLELVRAAGDHPLHERRGSVALELLVERRALPEDLAVRIVTSQFERPLTPDDHDDIELVRAAMNLLSHVHGVRILEVLAPMMVKRRGVWPGTVLALLEEHLETAWLDETRGFDDADPPCGYPPEAGWRELLDRISDRETPPSHVDLDMLRAGLDWTYLPRVNRVVRRIDSGAEQGAAFALAGFDVTEHQEKNVLRALDGLGGRAITNLHLVCHQCGGYGCAQVTLLGLPLASAALRDEVTPGSEHVEALLEVLSGSAVVTRTSRSGAGRASDPGTLDEVRRRLLPFAPGLPRLEGGTEAIVWTAPGTLCEATRDLEVVRILPASRPWRETTGFFDAPYDVMRPSGAFGDAHEGLLLDVGRRLRLGKPRLFVVWANSD